MACASSPPASAAISSSIAPIVTDADRIHRHIIPLLGTRRVKDLTKADINKALKDIMAGKTAVSVKTKKLRGKAIVRGGAGTAKPKSLFDFVQGITAVARDKTHQDARLDLEARAKKLLDRAA